MNAVFVLALALTELFASSAPVEKLRVCFGQERVRCVDLDRTKKTKGSLTMYLSGRREQKKTLNARDFSNFRSEFVRIYPEKTAGSATALCSHWVHVLEKSDKSPARRQSFCEDDFPAEKRKALTEWYNKIRKFLF